MKSSLADTGLLIFRIGVSYLMITYHGWGKFQQLISGDEIQFADPVGLGVILSFILAFFAEFICSLFVAAGLWTRWAAIPLLITMAVAFFIYHAPDPFANRQLPALFLLSYILILFLGPGKYSLDYRLRRSL